MYQNRDGIIKNMCTQLIGIEFNKLYVIAPIGKKELEVNKPYIPQISGGG